MPHESKKLNFLPFVSLSMFIMKSPITEPMYKVDWIKFLYVWLSQ